MKTIFKNLYGRSIVIFFCVFAIFCSSLGSQDINVVGPYQVIIYSSPDYIGQSQSFILNIKSHRIKPVNRFNGSLDNKVSSIHVGSKVKAILFDHHDFHANPQERMGRTMQNQQNFKMDHEFKNVEVYDKSIHQVKHNDVYTSMVIIPKDLKDAWGIALYNYQEKFARIEPIPDQKIQKQKVITDFGDYLNKKIDHIRFLGNPIGTTKIDLYEHTHFKGKHITLPGFGSNKSNFILKTYQFDRITSSIKVRIKDPEADFKKVSTYLAGSKILENKVIKPVTGKKTEKDQGLKMMESGDQLPAVLSKDIADIKGLWQDKSGNSYEFVQNGQTFTWFSSLNKGRGEGYFLKNKKMKIIWHYPKDKGQTYGQVTKVNPVGKAEEIKMDDGVVLFRK
ncbi:MAG: hypothetical protein ABFR36_10305 [Acidobacteriota bacterium]